MAASVLIAHGNTQRLKQAVELLRQVGFDVVATPDGGDAFARFFECEPSLVICNRALPSLEGSNFARMVRSQAPDVPVVIIDDLLDPDDQLETDLDAKVFVVPDPLSIESLQLTVPELLQNAATIHVQDHDSADDWEVPPSSTDVFIHAALKRFQRDSNLLGLLDGPGLTRVAQLAKHEVRQAGEVILRQGDIGSAFYLVVEGQVRVTLAEKNDEEVARLGAGGFFGEMALLSDTQRSASVSAVGESTLLCFERVPFLPILNDYPVLRDVLSGVALQRTEENLWRVLFADEEVADSIASLGSDDAAEAGEEKLALDDGDGFADAPPAMEMPSESFGAAYKHLDEQPLGENLSLQEQPTAIDAQVGNEGDEGFSPAASGAARASPASALHGKSVALGFAGGALMAILLSWAFMPAAAVEAPLLPEPVKSPGQWSQEPSLLLPAGDDVPHAGEAAAPEPAEMADDVVEEPAEVPPQPEQELDAAQTALPSESEPAAIAAIAAFDDDKRRETRRAMFGAANAERHDEAERLGAALEARQQLDWEAEFKLAELRRLLGKDALALQGFLDFARKYPTNLSAADALFWSAEIYQKQGNAAEARKYYKAVLNDSRTNFRSEAENRLKELPEP